MRRNFHSLWFWLALAGALGITCLLAACSASRVQPAVAGAGTPASVGAEVAAGPVWPAPPFAPRIRYVRSIGGPSDIGQHPSVWRRAASWLTGDRGEQNNLQKPLGVSVDDDGNLCLTDTGNNRVCFVDLARKTWRYWDTLGKTRLQSPVSVVHRAGVFYVADSELGRVIAFDDHGRVKFEIAAPLQRPVGLALLANALVVVDAQLHSVLVFDWSGKLQFQFGKRGTGPGEFNFPTHVTADARGHLLVTDSLNSRVQVFSEDGHYISEIGSGGDTSGHFGRPKGVAVDAQGHVYVADAVFDNVQIFDLSGQLLLALGESGTAPGEFGLPAGVATGPGNRIYVADSFNHRVQVLQYLDQP